MKMKSTEMPESIKKEFVEWFNPLLHKEPFTLLDLGCGNGQRTKHFNFSFCIGVDIDNNHIGYYRPKAQFINMDVMKFLRCDEWKDKKWDVVAGFEIVEHLYFEEALQLIKFMKARAEKLLIIVSPDGFSYNFQDTNIENNPYEHRCGFTQENYEFLGFTVKRNVGVRMGLKVTHDKLKIPYPPSWDRLMAYWRP